jgi:putative Holliday junction resolvase
VSLRGRILGIDWGARRIGLAISDPSGTLARPFGTVPVSGAADAITKIAAEMERISREEDGLSAVVVGVPRRLDGSATGETREVEHFVQALTARTRLPILLQDERLSSHEAVTRLGAADRDWRLDAAAAAVILQDYLDRHAT